MEPPIARPLFVQTFTQIGSIDITCQYMQYSSKLHVTLQNCTGSFKHTGNYYTEMKFNHEKTKLSY